MMPESYAYYTNNESGLGAYPTNSQRLTDDAIQIADADVDFSLYDFNNDGDCDGVILIHAGAGFETSGLTTDIWSHKWSIRSPRSLDGVWVDNYNMNPEEYITGGGTTLSPIGVFCHEYGHFLGLPDLYDTSDTTNTSSGLGEWSLMASGNYNGPGDNSRYPAHFDPWCKSQIGFINLIDVTDNLYNVEIPQIETNPTAYRLRNAITGPSEYFIVENRQKVGFDAYLPSEGLLIYHIDETRADNTDFFRYKVALEQADNLNQLAFHGSGGDTGDPFPGLTDNREFQQYTAPNSYLYSGTASQIGVWNISNSDSIMTADLDVAYSRPWIESVGLSPFVMADADSDGILEPGETVQFFFSISNQMRITENVHATLSSDNPSLQFTQNNITVPGLFYSATLQNPSAPIEFIIPDTVSPRIDSFFLTITTDSLDAFSNPITGSVTHIKTFGFEFTIGQPNILIVDADRGDTLQAGVENSLYNKRVPTDTWDRNNDGTPNIGDIAPYDIILWNTGTNTVSGAINAADIAVMKQIMDAGKNLMLSTVGGVDDIIGIDSTLMTDYFHIRKDATVMYPEYLGTPGSALGNNMKFLPGSSFFTPVVTLIPIGAGAPEFSSGGQIVGVSYSGSYKSLFITFGADSVDNNIPGYNTQSDYFDRVVDFFGGIATDIYDGNPYARIPNSFDLSQNYPNPFNPTTTIRYTIRPTDEIGAVTRLDVFNMMGQKVITLVDEAQIPGNYEVQWDGVNSNHQEVSSGMYFYRLTRGSEYSSKKMTLLK